jgi:hypothetical protein
MGLVYIEEDELQELRLKGAAHDAIVLDLLKQLTAIAEKQTQGVQPTVREVLEIIRGVTEKALLAMTGEASLRGQL